MRVVSLSFIQDLIEDDSLGDSLQDTSYIYIYEFFG